MHLLYQNTVEYSQTKQPLQIIDTIDFLYQMH